MTGLVRVPAEPKPFSIMSQELHLGVDVARGQARVLRAIPDHDPPICAHCRDNVRVLWLVTRLVDLALVVNFLDNVEFDLHLRLLGTPTIASNFTFLLVVIIGIRGIGIGKLHMGNLEVIRRIIGGMCSDQEAMSRVGLVGDSAETPLD